MLGCNKWPMVIRLQSLIRRKNYEQTKNLYNTFYIHEPGPNINI